ncbi:hypothetical protein H6769_02255 [Candidatus Peribacteria bacterium]|nr:hypothetical protein [Candidatus Peribacteria bacterium]
MYNGSVTLSWDTNNITSCTATNFTLPSNYLTANKSISLNNLTSSKTYTLSCTGPGGSTSQSVTVNVANPVAPSVTLTTSLTSGYNGTPTTLAWTVSNATSCSASGGWS